MKNMKLRKRYNILCLITLLLISLCSCSSNTSINNEIPESLDGFNNELIINLPSDSSEGLSISSQSIEENDNSDVNSDTSQSLDTNINSQLKDITVKFIDVKQADSCLIVTSNNDAVLIDTGDSSDASEVLEVLNQFDIEDIDLMVLTHPHKDHIGGAKTILETYTVKEVLMSSFVTDTKVFNNILDLLDEQDIKVTQAELGKEYNIDNVEFQVVGVDSVSKDNNNSSVVLKMTYGTVDILFTGDAETPAEQVILNNGFDLNCEVLKVGHHGSDTSTSEEFLNTVNPKMAIISCGKDNKYGHPAEITFEKLKSKSVQYYRTDEVGTVTLEIDGENIVTSFEDTYVTTSRNSSFLYTPNIAEVEINLEDIAITDNELGNSELNEIIGE